MSRSSPAPHAALAGRPLVPGAGRRSYCRGGRTVGALEEIDDAVQSAGSSATLVPLDIRDYPGIYRLAAALNERHQHLDILVGNAGVVGQRSPLDHIDPKNWDDVMAVNVTANWHLIRAMDPLLKRAESRPRRVYIVRGGDPCPRL